MKQKKLIVFTGGGTAGHVTPNIALIEKCQAADWQVAYIGSAHGIEKKLIEQRQVPYYSIATGKLRRYFSWKNFIDPFKIFFGLLQSLFILLKLKPKIIFSKGGFVAFPVVFAGWLLRIPVIAHESDITPGLSNRLCLPFIKKLCVTYPVAAKNYSSADAKKTVVTGIPLRASLYEGDAERGRRFCEFDNDNPCLMIVGGGLGATLINEAIRNITPLLTKEFNVIHLCGAGKLDPKFEKITAYKQFEYVDQEMADLYACADVIVSRSGANSLFELLALRKPHILIPLSKKASRGDQIDNARYTEGLGLSTVIAEEELSGEKLLKLILSLNENLEARRIALAEFSLPQSTELVVELIDETASS